MNDPMPHHELLTTRRDFLRRSGAGFGALALSSLLGKRSALAALGDADGRPANPMAARLPHHPGRAKHVIFLFVEGAESSRQLRSEAAAAKTRGPAAAAEFWQSHHRDGRGECAPARRSARVVVCKAVTGEPLHEVKRLDIIHGSVAAWPDGAQWMLRGVTSNERYATRAEKDQLVAVQAALGRPEATHSALIPIRKNAQWWALAPCDF